MRTCACEGGGGAAGGRVSTTRNHRLTLASEQCLPDLIKIPSRCLSVGSDLPNTQACCWVQALISLISAGGLQQREVKCDGLGIKRKTILQCFNRILRGFDESFQLSFDLVPTNERRDPLESDPLHRFGDYLGFGHSWLGQN